MTEFERVKYETVKFMRGKYKLDEVGNGKDQVKFKQGAKTIVTIDIREDKYTFLIIFGRAEREKFEAIREEFSQYIKDHYDNTKTYHDGKWMFIDVATLAELEVIKKLILIKKNPNRKPFPKGNALYGKCGHRCDLCVHYTGITEEFREMLIPHLNAVYGGSVWDMRCTGCDTPNCHCCCDGNELCESLKCLLTKQFSACSDCINYPCEKATVGYRSLEPRNISADDVTWAILPYVPFQYGN
ncbi:MAG: DUF3788 family protein [Eubacteriales bacterium]|nr:DUF3788 family protein [Eubacteriales bacterium]MDD4421994.1 DUF3788 family protein [Eubacteriales bacterium]HBR31435.1 hypothetical protein [Clostridiales bacterium]